MGWGWRLLLGSSGERVAAAREARAAVKVCPPRVDSMRVTSTPTPNNNHHKQPPPASSSSSSSSQNQLQLPTNLQHFARETQRKT